ncbi:trypsin-like [Bacillus rossius redtenbacheri]|uniref:trypsin-like n=1 Tax=Bacillus rossius redtenbacheri TaxID=93214 RepID=UPI002FDD3990
MLAVTAWFGVLALGSGLPHVLGADSRIVGGHGAYIQDFPYMVSVNSYIAGFIEEQMCGGSIISADWLLTSASCIQQYASNVAELRVRVGSSKQIDGTRLEVSEVILHPNFTGTSSPDYDISLVKVKTPLVFNSTVQAVRLAEAGASLAAGTEAVHAGWGTVETGGLPLQYLRQLRVPVLSAEACSKDYPSGLDHDSMFCAGYDEAGKGPCQGDQGGPLVVNSTQVGLLSWGVSCAAANQPGVYTRLSHHRAWITASTGV